MSMPGPWCGSPPIRLARSLLVEALDLMDGCDDDRSMALVDAIESAIACLPDPDMDEEADEL